MNVTAAMPVNTVNTELMGTAAATDIANTGTGNFGDALESMISEHNFAGVRTAKADVLPAPQEQDIPTADDFADLNTRELLEKYSGYAQSEIISMLLSGSSEELDMLFDFNGLIAENDRLADTISELSQSLAYNGGLAKFTAAAQTTDNVKSVGKPDISADEATPTENETSVKFQSLRIVDEGTGTQPIEEKSDYLQVQAPVSDGFESNSAELKVTHGNMNTSQIKADDLQTESQNTVISERKPDDLQTWYQSFDTSESKSQSEQAINLVQRENNRSTNSFAGTSSVVETDSKVIDSAAIEVNSSEKTAQTILPSAASAHTEKSEQVTSPDSGTLQHTDKYTENSEPVNPAPTTVASQTADTSNEVKIPLRFRTYLQQEAVSEQASATPQQVESLPHRIVTSGRRVEEKSDEAIRLAKQISGTKSDSDLNARQKITEKQGAQESPIGADSRTAKADTEVFAESKPEAPARMTLNEVYSFIAEKAVKPGKTTFTVILTPETLGKITVKMSSESGRLSVEILTETQSAKRLFEARASELVDNLRQNDVEVQSYKVESDSELFNQSFDGSSKNPYKQQQSKSGSQDKDEFERLFEEIVSMS